MADQTTKVDGVVATLVKDGETPVYLLPDGRFAVRTGDRWHKRATLRAAETVTRKLKTAVPIFGVGDDKPFQAVEVTESGIFKDAEGRQHNRHGYRSRYVWDATLAAAYRDVDRREEAAREAFREERRAIEAKLVDVNKRNFEEVRRRFEAGELQGAPDYAALARKFVEAGNAAGDGIGPEELAALGLKKPAVYSSLVGRRLKTSDWEGLCTYVFEGLVGREMPKCNLAGRGSRSRWFGEKAAEAIREKFRVPGEEAGDGKP